MELTSFIGEDLAESFYNSEFKESYHSKVGPIIEAKDKFIYPSCIKERLEAGKEIKILDPFFGLGYNTGIALDYSLNINPNANVQVMAIEKDINILKQIKSIQVPKEYEIWKTILTELPEKENISYKNININLQVTDIFKVIDLLPKNFFNVVLFDPFSHKVAPEFWEERFISKVLSMLAPGGTLTTYSKLKRIEDYSNEHGYKTKRIKASYGKKHSLCIVKESN